MTTSPDPIWSPYSDGTSGHQGDSSKDAEKHNRRPLIERAFIELSRAGTMGLTWLEFARLDGLHHGQASAALSNLHRSGTAERLKQRRSRCGIYVLAHHVNGRETVAYNPNSRDKNPEFYAGRMLQVFDEKGNESFIEQSSPRGTIRISYTPRGSND